MNALAVALNRITRLGVLLGGAFLTIGMLILVANIFGRAFHFVIFGSIEMFELLMVVPLSFGLVYTALKKGHVVVNLVITRFPEKFQAAAEIFTSLLSLIIWLVIAWAAGSLAFENGMIEVSETLEWPYLPFRLIWTFCLILFGLTYLEDLLQAVRRLVKK